MNKMNCFNLIKENILQFVKEIIKEIKSIDSDILGFLNDTSAIIASIIALITIIYTFYNEKVIQTIGDYIKNIKELLNSLESENANQSIIKKLNEVKNLTLKESLYKETILVFKLVLYLLAIPWGLAGTNHLLNSKNTFEIIISIIPTIIFIFVFIYIPKLFERFNDLKSNDLSFFNIEKFINFLKDESSLSLIDIFKKFINPSIIITYKDRDIHINFEENIQTKDKILILSLKHDRESHLLVLRPQKDGFHILNYQLDNRVNNSLEGLFEKIKSIRGTQNKLYILSTNSELSYTFNVNIKKDSDNIKIYINQLITNSLPTPIRQALNDGNSYLKSKVDTTDYYYSVK